MELQTTVRNFVNVIAAHHIASDMRIRVIIEDPQQWRESIAWESFSVPSITRAEQQQSLNSLPRDYDPFASDELITIIEMSHTNTELLEI